jgi:hypothetical protein
MVIDPSMFAGPVTIAQWEAQMNDPNGQTQITGADQLFYGQPPLAGQARLRQFAESLAFVSGVRSGYQPLRALALAAQGLANPPAPAPVPAK